MEKKINKIFVFLFLLLFTFKISALELNSEKYILYNLNENKILLEKDAHVQTDIASLTKIMTFLLAVEHTDDYSKQVTITKEMLDGIAWDVAVVGFKKGEKVTYDDLLYGAMLESGADATNALAILVSGSKKEFVKKMNEKVKELNLQNTSFANVVGLYDKNNYSSAYDMAELLKYALKNPKFKELFETKTYKLTTGKEIKSTLIHYSKQDTSIKINNVINSTINNKLYYIISEEELNELYIHLPKNTYTISNLEISYIDPAHLENITSNIDILNIDHNNSKGDTLQGTIEVTKDSYLTLLLPYTKGFNRYVDGELTEYQETNNNNIGLPIKEGIHDIEIEYQVPYKSITIVVSTLGIFIFLTVTYLEYKRKF